MNGTKLRAALLIALALTATGCSTYAVPRYTSNADTVQALRALNVNGVAVGSFTSSKQDHREIMCRGVGPIKTPDGESFTEFVRKAFVSELKFANIHRDVADITISGNLNGIDFSSLEGAWNLDLTLMSSKGRSFNVKESYQFTTSYYGETACNQTAQALMPAVQNLVTKAVRSREFQELVGN